MSLSPQQQELWNQTADLLNGLNLNVPPNVAHYAVEGARRYLAVLLREIDKGTVRTDDVMGARA